MFLSRFKVKLEWIGGAEWPIKRRKEKHSEQVQFAASTAVEKARSNKANEQIEVLKTDIEKYTALRICTQTLRRT